MDVTRIFWSLLIYDHETKHSQRLKVNKRQLLPSHEMRVYFEMASFWKRSSYSWGQNLAWIDTILSLSWKIAVRRLQFMSKRGRSYWHIHVADLLNIS